MTTTVRTLRLWQDRVCTDVEVSGSGPAVVYLHGPWGLTPDRPFVEQLARRNTVYAPKHPGTSPGNHDAVHALDSWLDLVVYYGELFDRLELHTPTLIGHSFGALVAAEYAAAVPRGVARIVLIDPVGLWRDEAPVRNWMILSDAERSATLFHAPQSEAAKRFFAVPTEVEARIDTVSQFVWAQACTGKFVWPIADRGLKLRIHRIAAPALLVWGASDRIVAPSYADEFARRITGARIARIEQAGHLPHLEQPEAVAQAIGRFVAA